MKYFFPLIAFFLLLSQTSFAQSVMLKGKLVNTDQQPVEFANAYLMSSQDSTYIEGDVTKEDGLFSISTTPGKYILHLNMIGFQDEYLPITITKDTNIGTKVLQDNIQLDEVQITYKRSKIESQGNKTIFRVSDTFEANISTSSYDLLKRVPGLIVDTNSNSISIVGRSVARILVNGRMVNLSGEPLNSYLKSINPTNIEKIELMQNPPARYDAEGNAGLINIVLKHRTSDYLGGAVGSTYKKRNRGQDLYNNVALNYSKKDWNLSTSLNYDLSNPQRKYDITQENIGKLVNPTDGLWSIDGKGLGFNLATDYKINNRWFVGLGYTFNNNDEDEKNTGVRSAYDLTENQKDLTYINHYFNIGNSLNRTHNLTSFIDYSIDDQGGKLSLEAGTVLSDGSSDQLFDNQLDHQNGNIEQIKKQNQFGSESKVYTLGLNASKKIHGVQWSAGLKYTQNQRTNDFKDFDYQDDQPILNLPNSSEFDYNESISAIYTEVNKNWKNISLQLGLRGEYTKIATKEHLLDSANNSDYFKIFPTFNLSYTDSSGSYFGLSYNRRLTRPGMGVLSPAVMFFGEQAIVVGNPYLTPMYINDLSFKYQKGNLSAGVGYSIETDMYNAEVQYFDTEKQMYVNTRFNNFEQHNIYGYINYNYRKFSWWESNNTIYAKHFLNTNTNQEFDIADSEGWEAYFSTQNTFFPIADNKNFSLNFHYWFNPRIVTARETTYGKQNLDIGANLLLLDRKLIFSAQVTDIFDTNIDRQTTIQNDVILRTNFNNDVRSIQVGVRYIFGGNKKESRMRRVNRDSMRRL
ncbi:outer membrane beta-barrel protein [Persicobacter psychrovividus]|uniref:TonB-dependent receptor n=1 Tax=Persicobacter psychrovividus TaxID=387638 RepID=A0ABM7VG73_9BACT|nr:TonB-dependent receptor [Persicobacter psychrovividus]